LHRGVVIGEGRPPLRVEGGALFKGGGGGKYAYDSGKRRNERGGGEPNQNGGSD